MTESTPLQDLACKNCGAPIRTTAAPGTTVNCDCCGSAFLIPAAPSKEATVRKGAVINNSIVTGDVTGGNKTVIVIGPQPAGDKKDEGKPKPAADPDSREAA